MSKNAVLALFLMGAAIPSAQAAVGLAVDNLANGADAFPTSSSGTNWIAGSFTTGGTTAWLDHIDLSINSGTAATLTVGVYAESASKPNTGSLVAALSAPGLINGAGIYTYTGTATLTASTSYWVVASSDVTVGWNKTATTAEAASYTGWTMNDGRGWSTDSGGTWAIYGSAPQFAVYADEAPEPEALAGVMLTGMFGLLALKRRRRDLVAVKSDSVPA